MKKEEELRPFLIPALYILCIRIMYILYYFWTTIETMKFVGGHISWTIRKKTYHFMTVKFCPPSPNSALKYQSTYLLQGFGCVLNQSSRTHLTRLHSNTQISLHRFPIERVNACVRIIGITLRTSRVNTTCVRLYVVAGTYI